MNGILPILKKECREIWRDPYTLGIALLLPLVLLFMFGYALNLDVKDISLAVVDLDHSHESRTYTDPVVNSDCFDLRLRRDNIQGAARFLH